jgi:hypothetical protein
MNEVWPLFRTLWRAIDPYKMSITYEPTFDMHELGHRLACDLNAVLSFNIDPEGNWDADFDFKFNQTSEQSWVSYAWPDYSFEYSYKDTGSWVRDC